MTLQEKKAIDEIRTLLERYSASISTGRIEIVIDNGCPTHIWNHECNRIENVPKYATCKIS